MRRRSLLLTNLLIIAILVGDSSLKVISVLKMRIGDQENGLKDFRQPGFLISIVKMVMCSGPLKNPDGRVIGADVKWTLLGG